MQFWIYTKHLYLIIKFYTHTKKLHFLYLTENVSAKHMVHILYKVYKLQFYFTFQRSYEVIRNLDVYTDLIFNYMFIM